MEESNMDAIYATRRKTIMYSQTSLQPLQSNVQPGFQQNIFIQPSKQFMDLGKQRLMFRPTIQFGVDNGLPDLARKAMLGISPVSAADFLVCQSILINGQQIMSQSQSQLQRTRNIYQNWFNSLKKSDRKKHLSGTANFTCGQNFPSANSNAIGVNMTSYTHPCPQPSQMTSPTVSTASALDSRSEGLEYFINPSTGVATATGKYFPRAICSRNKVLNQDMIWPVFPWQGGNPATQLQYNHGHENFASLVDQFSNGGFLANGGSSYGNTYTINSGNAPVLAGGTIANLPAIGGLMTASVCVYLSQQDRFEYFRKKFLTQTVTPFQAPFQQSLSPLACLINATLSTVQIMPAYTSIVMGVQGQVAATCSTTNPLTTTVGGSAIRAQEQYGTVALGATGTGYYYQPGEQFTQLEVSLGELSMELSQIGEVCLEGKSIQIQLQFNLPQNVLSAFLQPSLMVSSDQSVNGATTQQCQAFLQAMTLGSAWYVVNDMCMRHEYIDYQESSYELIKRLKQQPVPYLSLRQQIDPIPIAVSGTFTQRIAISNPIVVGFVCFIVPTNNNKATYLSQSGSQSNPLQQDCLINYQGCNPVTDMRATVNDSYYVQASSWYLDTGDGRRYNSSDVPISSREQATFLVGMDGLASMFGGRTIELSLQEYLQNRFFFCIPFNTNADPALALSTSQVIISATFDFTSRIQNSKLYQECNTNCANQWSLLTFAVTAQSLVGDVVRV